MDLNVAKCVVDSEVDTILSEDSDFTMYLGSSSDYFDMIIKDVSIDKKYNYSCGENSD